MTKLDCESRKQTRDLRERARRDHTAMSGVVSSIAEAEDRSELKELLTGFRVILSAHHDFEEGKDGLFESIVASAPRHQGKVKQLLAEHAELVRSLEALITRSAAVAAPGRSDTDIPDTDIPDTGIPDEGLFAEVRVFIARLHEHDASENELLMDSISTDIGGRG